MVSPTTDRRLGLVGNTPYKAAATVVATSNITLSGEQTIDGVAVVESNSAGRPDRVLCIGQTSGVNNGLWEVSSGSWTRPKDANGNFDLASGTQVIVTRGTHAFEVYVLSTADPITIDTTSQTWQASLSSGSLATLAASGGSALMGFLQAGTSAVARTVQSKLRDCISAFDFMTSAQQADVLAGTKLLDVTAAVQAALTAALAQKKALHCPGGTYRMDGAAGSDTFANGLLVPFDTVNSDPSSGVLIFGDAGLTRFSCGSNSMILLRISRNCVTVKDIVLDCNGKTTVYLCGIVPESVTQTTTQVSQSFITLENVDMIGGASVEGLVIQPGPQVGGGDSGCFYHNIIGGYSNFVGGGRHVYTKKNADWATHPNKPTRTNFVGRRLLRGNVGYYFEVGSEINLILCNEELITSGVTPVATPVARFISSDCANINFFGGYSEACTKAVTASSSNFHSWGYIPASGSNTDWRTYADAYADGTDDSSSWTPVLVSSGGGAQGAATSTGKLTKLGKIVHFTAQVSAAKGTLAAGTLSVTGLPFIADASWTGADFQGIPVTKWSGITFTANVTQLAASISGASLAIRKLHAAGAGVAGLTLAECADPVVFTVQGWYKTA